MGRQRAKKDEGAAKGQAVISSFFAPKEAATSGEKSFEAAPGTVVWPSPGRLSHLKDRLAANAANESKKRALNSSHSQEGSASWKKSKGKESIGPNNIPPSDPARHQKFLNTLLGKTSAVGTESTYYGKPPSGNEKYTPLEQQVVELKAKYPDVLLMIEVGYKFRFFGDDAEKAAKVLGIVAYYSHSFLTASIPTFRLHVHVRRLVEAGYKVGVVKQTETAAIKAHGANKAGPFTRDLSALYTKATLEAAEHLGGDESGENDGAGRLSSYIMCIVEETIPENKKDARKQQEGVIKGNFDVKFGVVAVETSTGDVMHGHFMDNVTRTELEARLLACAPAELLLSASLSSATKKLLLDYAGSNGEVRIENISENTYPDGGAAVALADFFGNRTSSESSGGEERVDRGLEALMAMPEIVVAAFAHILCYLKQFNLENVLRLGATFQPFVGQQEMLLSPNTLRQLEILHNQADGNNKGSLFWLMNHTKTPFGARLLRYWITHPLRDHMLISSRLDAVAEIAKFVGSRQNEATLPGSSKGAGALGPASRGACPKENLLASIFSSLGKMPDIERGITRIFHKTATTSEFMSVMKALTGAAAQFQQIQNLVVDSSLLTRLVSAATSSSVVQHANKLVDSLNADAAATSDKLNLFVSGQFPEVDDCKLAIKCIEEELEGFLPSYQKLLRIPKLQYLSVSGSSFLVEVPCAQRVPSDWVKINSTKKSNRYHPPEVLDASERLALAKERLTLACARAWETFLTEFASHYVDFRASVQAIAALDCLYSLAVVSCSQGYVRPEFASEEASYMLRIEAGRHPVLDSTLQDAFVPNDTFLSGEAERCQIVTGPNMGGKSCYIRQVALITIMAQIGSYVPAASAKLHVFDAVFTRMGALDRIQKGSSTFFEEMSEASIILQKATARSLVVMDELGRGTSTHDGVAIAYAALHYLLQDIKCFTLFVTHYLKITEVVKEFPGAARAYHMSYLTDAPDGHLEQRVEEVSQKVTFLYKVRPGAASRSFGIHVARLAKVPDSCVARAAEKAAMFEEEMALRRSRSLDRRLLLFMEVINNNELSVLKDVQRKIKEIKGFYSAGPVRKIS